MEPANTKNTYELLSMSDSDSNSPQQMQELHLKSPRRKRLRKKLPSYRVRRYEDSLQTRRCCQSYGKFLSLSFIIVILCCWLLILSWLVLIFNDELKRFDNNIMAVVVGNQGIPESLQKCHMQTKELQNNQTDLYTRYVNLNSMLSNLSLEISSISSDISVLRNRFNSTGDTLNVSVYPKELSENVEFIKNWVLELNNTVTQLTVSKNRLEEDFEAFQLNITNFREKLLLLEKVPNTTSVSTMNAEHAGDAQKLISIVNALTDNVTYLNNSLTSEIQLMKENNFQDRTVLNDLKMLLSQNISFRLNTLQEEFNNLSQMSGTVQNLTSR